MKDLRIAVVGGGHLGSIHAKLLQQVPHVQLAGILEPSEARAAELREILPCAVDTDVEHFLSTTTVDGVVLAAPTTLHHEVGIKLLERGIHCLIEKPLAPTVAECEDLVAAAEQANCILQVGHVERFNPAWTAMRSAIGQPKFIQAFREAPLTFRSLDAGVVLDLMVHDLDLVLSLVTSPVAHVQASGLRWTGPSEDMAQARVTFANGCVAHFTASRVSCAPKRSMRLIGADWYSEIDFAARKCHVVDRPETNDWQSKTYSVDERKDLMDRLFVDVLPRHDLDVPEANPILDELVDFTTSIRTSSQPIVSGEAGLNAVAVSNQIVNLIARQGMAPSFAPPKRKAG